MAYVSMLFFILIQYFSQSLSNYIMKQNIMFTPWTLGSLKIKNRLVRSATVEGLSTDDGAPSQRLIDMSVELAEGGVGLIVAGTAYISKEGKGDLNTTGLDNDQLIEPLYRWNEAVREAGGLLAAQLLHCGSTMSSALLQEKDVLMGPSAMIDPICGRRVLEMSRADIHRIIDQYGMAALRAQKAGFQAVQIHAAHGYLLNQFLSPFRNSRSDEYGGSLKNRALLLYQVYETVRNAVGKDMPIFIKLSGYDGFMGGFESKEAAEIAANLDDMGIDAIEVSAGTPEAGKNGGWDHIRPAPFKEGSLFNYALQIKAMVTCPVISVEGWRTPLEIEKALKHIDVVSMSRPFIREPNLVNRWFNGDVSRSHCTSCNKCLALISKTGLRCVASKP